MSLEWTAETIEKFEQLFPIHDIADHFEFSHLHLVVTKRRHLDLNFELQKPVDRDYIDARDKFGQSALHWAVRRSSDRDVQILLRNGANPNTVDNYGRTPLFSSAKRSLGCTKLLLEAGADISARSCLYGEDVIQSLCVVERT